MYSQLTTRKVPTWIPFQIGNTFQLVKAFRLDEKVPIGQARPSPHPAKKKAILALTEKPQTEVGGANPIPLGCEDER